MTPTDPTLSRRAFVAGSSALVLGARLRHAAGPLLHVGTYTANTKSAGVYAFHLDPATGALSPVGAWDAGPNPSFLVVHPTRRMLYAVNETGDGAVSSATLAASGALTLRGHVASEGRDPCYVSLDRTARWALVANYSSGTLATFPVGADGTLGSHAAVARHEGHGPNAARQEGPHAHCVITDPTNRWALAADLGIDRVMVYRFDAATGALTPAPTPFLALKPGAGPRHLAFDPAGRTLIVANELDLTLTSFRWDATAGTLAPLASAPLAPGLTPGKDSAADVHVAPSGRFVYASVRGDDSIVVFALDARSGALTPIQHIPTGGSWPRNFALDPSGKILLVANQKSNDIFTFHIDPQTGRLTPTGQRAEVPAPVCIRFGATS